jgi:Flp pilus assembly protein TadD
MSAALPTPRASWPTDDSRRDLLQAVAIEPNSAAAHEALGTLAMHAGDASGAPREYQRAVALDPRSSTAHSGLGLLYLKLGQKDKAAEELSKAHGRSGRAEKIMT